VLDYSGRQAGFEGMRGISAPGNSGQVIEDLVPLRPLEAGPVLGSLQGLHESDVSVAHRKSICIGPNA
jgi:hypothetical protein